MERIQLISTLLNSAINQTNLSLPVPNAHAHFFTIDSEGRVDECNLIAKTVGEEIHWTICCIKSVYEDYGWQNNYDVFAIVNNSGKVVNKIAGSTWTLSKIEFKSNKLHNPPLPKVTFYCNKKPEDKLVFSPGKNRNFQQVWDFFVEINKHCNTLEEVRLYQRFFNLRADSLIESKTLDCYKREIEHKESIINQYKEVLSKIETLTCKCN